MMILLTFKLLFNLNYDNVANFLPFSFLMMGININYEIFIYVWLEVFTIRYINIRITLNVVHHKLSYCILISSFH